MNQLGEREVQDLNLCKSGETMRQGSQSRAESMHLHQSTYLDSDWLEKSDLFLVTSKQKSKLTQYPPSGSVSVIHTI